MSRCKSCGAEIIWIKTPAGKAMPCNPEPVPFMPLAIGDLQLVTENGYVVRGVRARAGGSMTAIGGYISHFATCPAADKHRRR